MIQILFAVLAGLLTVGAPCILPLLPILLGASVGRTSTTRPLFIALGFAVTFSVLGFTLSYIVQTFSLSPDTLRNLAVFFLALFGLFMVWPTPFEMLTQKLSPVFGAITTTTEKAGTGNFGGFVLGMALGAIWTPCAGPVLASVLTLIAQQQDLGRAAVLILAYALGAGIPMVLIAYGGQWVTTKVRSIAQYSVRIQQVFGIFIFLFAVAMFFKYDLLLQAKIIEYYPGIVPKF